MSREIRDLIRKMSLANPLWGAPRIRRAAQARIDGARPRLAEPAMAAQVPPRPGLVPADHRHDTAAVDVSCRMAIFQLLYALVVSAMSQELSSTSMSPVTRPKAAARQIMEAIPWDTAPRFSAARRRRVISSVVPRSFQAMAIEEVVTAPRSPWQNAYVERIIGSIRRECLNHVIVFNERHLRRVLSAYFDYHHRSRTHLRWTRTVPSLGPYSHPLQAPLSPSRRSAVYTIATSVAQREQVIVPGQPFRRGKLVVVCNCLPRMPWCPDLLDGAQIAAADTGLFEYQKLSAEAFVGNPMLWPDGPLSRDRRRQLLS